MASSSFLCLGILFLWPLACALLENMRATCALKYAHAPVHTQTELKIEMTGSAKGWLKRRDETPAVSLKRRHEKTPAVSVTSRRETPGEEPGETSRETGAWAGRQAKKLQQDESKKPQDDDALGALLRRLQVEWENASVALAYARPAAPVHPVWSASADASQLSSSSRLQQSSRLCCLDALCAPRRSRERELLAAYF